MATTHGQPATDRLLYGVAGICLLATVASFLGVFASPHPIVATVSFLSAVATMTVGTVLLSAATFG